jgi:hypothetical protein
LLLLLLPSVLSHWIGLGTGGKDVRKHLLDLQELYYDVVVIGVVIGVVVIVVVVAVAAAAFPGLRLLWLAWRAAVQAPDQRQPRRDGGCRTGRPTRQSQSLLYPPSMPMSELETFIGRRRQWRKRRRRRRSAGTTTACCRCCVASTPYFGLLSLHTCN